MKNMKKIVSLMFALVLTIAMSVTAFAETEKGSITINGVSGDNTYEIYKLLDLESYNSETGVYSYTVNSAWEEFFEEKEGSNYFTIDAQGYATWTAAEDDDTVATFAKEALAYAKEKGIAAVKSSKNAGEFTIVETTGKFTDLELGYYLIDSTMGALCGLTTTNPNASINAKNGTPVVDKQVQEDSTSQWGAHNTADVGQTVEFRVTIDVHAGAENYVLHDKMSEGLTFQSVSKIEHVIPGQETHTTAPEKYEVVTTGLTDDCTFEVRFTKEFCDSLETNDKVIVYYSAMLNRNAIIAEDGNPNETWLDYGEGNHTTHDKTETYTYGFNIVKTDGQFKLIDGAEFKIYDAATGGNEIGVVPLMEADDVTPVLDAKGNQVYRRARADEQADNKTVSIVVKNGNIRVVGFDNGTYYLEETVTPAGYNQLAARQKFIIADGNLDATFNGDIYSTGSGVHVVNKSGTMLPETGGMGTVLFITIGMFVVLATGVLLVTKKRMSMIQDW